MDREMEALCSDLRPLLTLPTIDPSELPRWKKMQVNLRAMLMNPGYRSNAEFKDIATQFITLNLSKMSLAAV